MKDITKNNVMKFYGLYWLVFNVFGTTLLIFLFNNFWMLKEFHIKYQIILYIILALSFLIFFNLILIYKNTLIIIRPLWFLYKKNSFSLSEIDTLEFIKIYHATSSSTSIKFLDEEGVVLLSTTLYWFKFEEKKFINKLKELGVKTEGDFD